MAGSGRSESLVYKGKNRGQLFVKQCLVDQPSFQDRVTVTGTATRSTELPEHMYSYKDSQFGYRAALEARCRVARTGTVQCWYRVISSITRLIQEEQGYQFRNRVAVAARSRSRFFCPAPALTPTLL